MTEEERVRRTVDGGRLLAITSKPPTEPHVRNRYRLLRHSLKNIWKSHNHRQHQMNRTDPHTIGGSSASGDVRKSVVLTPHSIGKSLLSVRRASEFNNSEPKHEDDKSQEDSNFQPERRERKRLELKNPESQHPERRPSGAEDGETQHPERKDRKVKHPELRVARDFKPQRPQHPGMKPSFAGSLGTQESEKKPSEARHHQPIYSQPRLSYSGTGSSVVRSRKSSSSAKTPTYVGSRRPKYSGEKPAHTMHLKAQYPNTSPSDSNQQETQGKRPQEFKHLEAQNLERNPSNLRQSEKKPHEIRDADQQYLERGSSEVRHLDPRHLRTELLEEIHQSSQILAEKPQNVKYQDVAYHIRLPSGVRYLDPQPVERRPSEDTFPEQEEEQQQLQERYLQPQFNEERYLQPQFHEERYPEVRYFETQQPMEQPTDVWNPGDPEPPYPRYETPFIRYLQLQQPDLKPQEVWYFDLQQPDLKPQEVRYFDLQQPDLKPQEVRYFDLQQPDLKPQEVRHLELEQPDTQPQEVRYLELEQPDTQPQEVRYLDLQQPDTQPQEVGYPGPPLPQRRPIEARYQNPEIWTGSLDDSDIMLTESHRRIRRAQTSGPIDSQDSENKRHLRIPSTSGSPSEGYQLGKRAQMEKYFRLLRSAERPEGGEILGEQNAAGSSRFKIVYEPVHGIPQAPDGSRPASVEGSDVNLPHQYPRPVRINVDDNRNKPLTDEYRYPGIMLTPLHKDQSPDGPVRRASTIDSKVSSDPRLRDDVNQASHAEGILLPTYSTHQQPSGEVTAWIDGSPGASTSHRRVPHHGNDIPRLPGNFDSIKYNHTDVHTVGIPQREMNGSVYSNVFKQQRPRLKDNDHFAGGAPLPASHGRQVPLRHYYLMGLPLRGQAKKVFLPRRDVDRILNAPVATESIIATTPPRIVPKQAMHLIDFLKTSDDGVPTRTDSIKWLTKTTSESGKDKGHNNMDVYGTARVNDSDISDGYGNSTVAGLTSDRGSENCTWPCDSTPGDGNGSGVTDSNATEDSNLEEIIPKVSGDFPSAVIGPRHSKGNSSNFIGSNPFVSKASDDHKSEDTSPKDFGSDGSKTSEATDSRDSEAGASHAYDKPDASDGEEAEDPGKENSENPDIKDPIRLEPADGSRTSVPETEGEVDHDINDSEGNSELGYYR
ncbi:uncharacterized protein [Panulirus ornatus]|uniref:uncharacterized protein isoform X2 n=1 Tax=Panulirus ornatus TaxID=150431 RepID=UPI003A87AE67